MRSSNSGVFQGWVLTEKLHASSTKSTQRENGSWWEITYGLLSTNFRVIGDVAFNILTPDDWMILVRFEELCDVLGPRVNGIKPLLVEYVGEVTLNGVR